VCLRLHNKIVLCSAKKGAEVGAQEDNAVARKQQRRRDDEKANPKDGKSALRRHKKGQSSKTR